MILHIDMDAFYASIEERDRPGLRGKPMVVGGNPDKRGVVAAANYAARRYGIHSAMPTAQAKHLCPHLIVLPPRHSYYAQVSQQIRDIFHRYTPLVEPLSLDEAFLDVKHSHLLFGEPADIGARIKREIRDELKLTASVGVAHNKFLAKVASEAGKPDGILEVNPAGVQAFLDKLPVSKLWGVGKVNNLRLQNLGIHTIGDLREQTPEMLEELFGSWGGTLWELAHGKDNRTVVPDHKAKSLSHETTFAEDITDVEALRGWLLDLTRQVAMRLRRNRIRGRIVHVKIRFADFRTITRQYQKLFEYENVKLRFTDDAIEAIAEAALARKIGARGLRMIIEDLMLDLMYNLPGQKKIRECVITREVVQSKEKPITLIEKAG